MYLPQIIRTAVRLAALGLTPYEIERTVKASNELRRLFERDCNEGDSPRRYRRELKLVNEVLAILAGPDVTPGTRLYVQGDPRGCALYVCGPEVPEPLEAHYDLGVAVAS